MASFSNIRKKVIQKLRENEIPFRVALPEVEKVILRPKKEVTDRVLCLYALIGLSMDNVNRVALKDWLIDEGVYGSLEIGEKQLFEIPRREYPRNKKMELSWLRESMFLLIWAGDYVKEELSLPREQVDIEKYLKFIPPEVPSIKFEKEFEYRSIEEIHFQVDLNYCLHSIIREDKIKEIDNSVLLERRRALEWLVSNDNWCEVSLDT